MSDIDINQTVATSEDDFPEADIVDVTVATAYLLVVYAIYMWIKRKLR